MNSTGRISDKCKLPGAWASCPLSEEAGGTPTLLSAASSALFADVSNSAASQQVKRISAKCKFPVVPAYLGPKFSLPRFLPIVAAFCLLPVSAGAGGLVTLAHPTEIPIMIGGRVAGSVRAPAGTKLELVADRGVQALVRKPGFDPFLRLKPDFVEFAAPVATPTVTDLQSGEPTRPVPQPTAETNLSPVSTSPDMTSLLPELKEALKSGEITTIKGFLKQNAGVTKATFTDGSLKRNTLNVAVGTVPASEGRVEVFRLLVKGGARADFIETRVNDPGVAYNAVSYPESLTVEELDFLLGAGADPDCGVCVPKTPPILRLCNMMFGEKGVLDTTLTKQEALDRIKVFVKHKANPAKLTGIATELTVNGTKLKPTSAAQLTTESGCEELKSALVLR